MVIQPTLKRSLINIIDHNISVLNVRQIGVPSELAKITNLLRSFLSFLKSISHLNSKL